MVWFCPFPDPVDVVGKGFHAMLLLVSVLARATGLNMARVGGVTHDAHERPTPASTPNFPRRGLCVDLFTADTAREMGKNAAVQLKEGERDESIQSEASTFSVNSVDMADFMQVFAGLDWRVRSSTTRIMKRLHLTKKHCVPQSTSRQGSQ